MGSYLIYPQIFAHHARQPDVANQATIEWGKVQTQKMLRTLNNYYLGQGCQYLCGDRITITDYFEAALMTVAEIIGNDLSDYANIKSWLNTIKSMPSWSVANDIHNSFIASM